MTRQQRRAAFRAKWKRGRAIERDSFGWKARYVGMYRWGAKPDYSEMKTDD